MKTVKYPDIFTREDLHIDEPAGAYELLLVVPAQPEIPEAL